MNAIPQGPLSPPPGRPSWKGGGNLPLLYLGWGRRDFAADPLVVHYDRGASYHVLLRGEMTVTIGDSKRIVRGPAALIFNPYSEFGLTQSRSQITDVLVWIWRGRPKLKALRPPDDHFLKFDLVQRPLDSLIDLHRRCRDEVSRADHYLTRTLTSLRDLVEVEILRASSSDSMTNEVRWDLAVSWIKKNLSLGAPIPALCDYLSMSPSTLYRFFRNQAGSAPGAYFRELKAEEAYRLIRVEGWQVKAAAYHLGYRHPNDLSRALSAHAKYQVKRQRKSGS